jgi:hypothetical protein
MKVFRDLFLRGEPEQLRATMSEVERLLSEGWSRDALAEGNLPALAPWGEPTYCFACAQRQQRPAAVVFVTQKEAGLFYVPNVIPRDQRELSHDAYNDILAEFHDRYVRPAADRTGVRVELTDTQADLSSWLSPAAAQKLRGFSAAANRSTGASHPSDQDRWMDFIVAAHRDGSRLDAHTLRRWLTEVENWPPEVAQRLALEYEFGKEVLAFSEGRRRSA